MYKRQPFSLTVFPESGTAVIALIFQYPVPVSYTHLDVYKRQYPYCAPEGMQAAYEILEGDGVETRWELDTTIVDKDNVKDWIGKGL